jgi:hypothetical protein
VRLPNLPQAEARDTLSEAEKLEDYDYDKAKKKICGFPVSSYKNLGRVGWF